MYTSHLFYSYLDITSCLSKYSTGLLPRQGIICYTYMEEQAETGADWIFS